MFRIPGKKGEQPKQKQVIYLQHGILDSADCWIVHKADKAPAFILVEAGYDVWLGNSRGNKYSRKHIKKDPDWDDSFWYFGWEEMGQYDVPANMEFIRKATGV